MRLGKEIYTVKRHIIKHHKKHDSGLRIELIELIELALSYETKHVETIKHAETFFYRVRVIR